MSVASIAIGWFVGRSKVDQFTNQKNQTQQNLHAIGDAEKISPVQIETSEFEESIVTENELGDDKAEKIGAIPNQRTLRFSSVEAMRLFLAKAGSLIYVIDKIDKLNALRVGFTNAADFFELLTGVENEGFIFSAILPERPTASAQSNAVPLGDGLLAWLGVDRSDRSWGKGVKIAILDTGVVPHSSFANVIKNIMLVPGSANYNEWNGHGTSVASLIVGQLKQTPGVAPGADLTSYRVANDLGQSDTWIIAKAIYEAVNTGNQVISISLGTSGDSPILKEAVTYANSKGVAVVAASGNEGSQQSVFPARYDNVITAVAVDAENNHLLFSNQSNGLTFSAPGWGVNAAYPNNKATSFSGTSASTPIISGVVAAVMSNGASGEILNAQQAVSVMKQYTNEVGVAGHDTKTGLGAPSLGRIFQRAKLDVIDAAVASQVIATPSNGRDGSLQVNIQNQGTAPLLNIPVTVNLPTGARQVTVSSLNPGKVQSFNFPLSRSVFANNKLVSIFTEILQTDQRSNNNQRRTTYIPQK
jgi:Subtilase family